MGGRRTAPHLPHRIFPSPGQSEENFRHHALCRTLEEAEEALPRDLASGKWQATEIHITVIESVADSCSWPRPPPSSRLLGPSISPFADRLLRQCFRTPSIVPPTSSEGGSADGKRKVTLAPSLSLLRKTFSDGRTIRPPPQQREVAITTLFVTARCTEVSDKVSVRYCVPSFEIHLSDFHLRFRSPLTPTPVRTEEGGRTRAVNPPH